jgi:ribosomal protein S18 acetylase RimI-like enzyme
MPDLRIIPLRELGQTAADRIFEEQCEEWLSRLRWDYAEPSRLLRGVLRKGELNGLVAVMNAPTTDAAVTDTASTGFKGAEAIPAGFSFYVVEGTRASIGDIYISDRYRGSGIDKELILAVLTKLAALPRLRRIESQSVSFHNQGADEVFAARGFERFERRFMMALLSSADVPDAFTGRAGQLATGPGTIRIRPWREDDYGAAVRTIFRSYRGEDDSRINSQYGSEEGCAELLSILTDTVWCGQFLPEASRVAACSVTGNQVGVLISSRLSSDTGHLGQISVLPAYQGRGVGRRLIQSAKLELCKRGFDCVSLAVTATNSRAVSLYESCGFSTIHSFPVYYWRRK